MNTFFTRIAMIACGLLLAGFGGIALADPYEEKESLHSYMRLLQDQSRLYSARMQAAAPGGKDRLIEEFRRRMNNRAEQLLHQQLDDSQRRGELAAGVHSANSRSRQRRDEYLRSFERMTELYISRYLQACSSKQNQPHELEAGLDELLQQVNAGLILHGNEVTAKGTHSEGLVDLARWREGEYRLLDQRADWEREVEVGYLQELRKIRSEYTQIEESYTHQLEELRNRCEQEEELRRQVRQDSIAELNRDFEALQKDVVTQTESVRGLLGQLSSAYQQSQTMLAAAEKKLYLQEDTDYWSQVRERELNRLEELHHTWDGLMQPVQNLPESLLEDETELLQTKIVTHTQRCEQYDELLQQNKPAAVKAFLQTNLQKDQSELNVLRAELKRVEEEIAAARNAIGSSDECAVQRNRLRRSTELRQIIGQLDQVGTFLAEGCSADRRRLSRMQSEIQESLSLFIPGWVGERAALPAPEEFELLSWESLPPEPSVEDYSEVPERLQQDTAAWTAALQQLYTADKGDEFLKQCALALYHENQVPLDPGYSEQNQSYRKLAQKLSSSVGAYLDRQAEEAFEELTSKPQHRRMYRFYALLVGRQPDPSVSYLSRAATEDLGETLFSGITAHACRRAKKLSDERDDLLKKVTVYSRLAAACYATLNFPGGAAMTALAASYGVKAADVKSKRDDLNALRRSLDEQELSGRDERMEIKNKLDAIQGYTRKSGQVRARLRRLEEEHHSDSFWRQKLIGGGEEFSFVKFFADDSLGLEPLFAFLKQNEDYSSAGEAEKGCITDYIQKMREIASNKKASLLEERVECAQGVMNTLLEAVQLSARSSLASALVECGQSLESLCGDIENAGGEVFPLLQIEGAGRIETARRRGILLEQRLRVKDELWRQRVELEIAAVREDRENELNELRSAGLRWDRRFRENYLSHQKLWEQRLNSYQLAQQRWLGAAIEKKAEQVSASGARILKLDPGCLSSRFTMVPMDSVVEWSPPATAEMESRDRDLNALFSSLEEGDLEILIPELKENRNRYAEYRSVVDKLYRDVERQSRRTAIEAGVRSLSAALRGHQQELTAMVDRANARAAGSLHTTLQAAGYRRRGRVFQRNAIVDVTYFEHERELQNIGEYCNFQLPQLNWEARLRSVADSGGDAAAVKRRYEELVRSIGAQRDLVFGNYSEDPHAVLQLVKGDLCTQFSRAKEGFTGSAGYSDNKKVKGLFSWHIGYAPVMSENAPEVVQRAGYGESGRILTAYYRNEARLGRGLSMMDQAGWDRRLWDDDIDNDGNSDRWMRAATIRSLSDLGVKTAAGLSMGPVAAALAGLSDDALFAAADISAGYKSWDEAAFSFGKQAVLQSAIAAGSGVWSGLEIRPEWDQTAGWCTNMTPAVGRVAGNRLLNAGAAGLEYNRTDGFGWSYGRFEDAFWTSETAVDLGLAAAGAVSEALVHNRFLQRKHTYGFSQDDIQAMREAAQFGGELLSSGIEYAATGHTTWNLLGLRGNGLLELNLDSGTTALAFGSRGRSLSPGKLANLKGGARLFALQQRIAAVGRSYAEAGREAEVARMLRFQAGFGDEQGRRVLKEILNGSVKLLFPHTLAFRGRTNAGSGHQREILISTGMHAKLETPSMALTLQHEAHRDGRLIGNDRETAEAVLAHAAMAAGISADPLYGIEFLYKDSSILKDMAAISSGERGVAALMRSYSSDGDFWRINAAGDLLWDGSHHLWGENGALVQTHAPGSFSQDVADYMGISREEALDLMQKAGYIWNERRGTYEKTAAEFGLKVRPELAAQYDLLRRFGERLNGQLTAVPDQYPDPALDSRSDRLPDRIRATAAGGVYTAAAYAWALREQAYLKELAEVSGGGNDTTSSTESDSFYKAGAPVRSYAEAYTAAMDALLATRDSFARASGLSGANLVGGAGTGFDGISQSATLGRYSQQRLEAAVTGAALDAAAGNGYCLAESLAAHYVDTFKGVDWQDIERAFAGYRGDGFDPDTGWVGDKQRFTAELSRHLGVDAVAREYRFKTLEEMNSFLSEIGPLDEFDDYSFIADYGGHFTHVRTDGIELNTYNSWSSPESGPQSWRLYAWDY